MIVLDVVQGEAEWVVARLGIPTASQFHRIVTPKTRQLSKQSRDYRRQLLAEWATGEPSDAQLTQWMGRGTELEPEARRWYAYEYDADLTTPGFCLTDDRRAGASPDGLVVDPERGLEIKCRNAPNHVAILLGEDIGADSQVQASMWVTGLAAWDVLAYNPHLPKRVDTIERDPELMAAYDEVVPAFLAELDAEKDALREKGVVPAHPDELYPRIDALRDAGTVSAEQADDLRHMASQGFGLMVRQQLDEIAYAVMEAA